MLIEMEKKRDLQKVEWVQIKKIVVKILKA